MPPESSPPNFLGITSLVIAIINTVLALLMFVTAGIIGFSAPDTLGENSLVLLIIGLVAIVCLLIGLLGIGLGVAGILIRNRHKALAIVGTVMNTAVVAVILGIIGFGLSREQ